jgi:hypothetical protein
MRVIISSNTFIVLKPWKKKLTNEFDDLTLVLHFLMYDLVTCQAIYVRTSMVLFK